VKYLANNTPRHVGPERGVSGEAKHRRNVADGSRRNEAILEVSADALPDRAIRGVLDDWLIPAIVERIIEERVQAEHES